MEQFVIVDFWKNTIIGILWNWLIHNGLLLLCRMRSMRLHRRGNSILSNFFFPKRKEETVIVRRYISHPINQVNRESERELIRERHSVADGKGDNQRLYAYCYWISLSLNIIIIRYFYRLISMFSFGSLVALINHWIRDEGFHREIVGATVLSSISSDQQFNGKTLIHISFANAKTKKSWIHENFFNWPRTAASPPCAHNC